MIVINSTTGIKKTKVGSFDYKLNLKIKILYDVEIKMLLEIIFLIRCAE